MKKWSVAMATNYVSLNRLPKQDPLPCHTAGFTLIESLVAGVLISLSVIAVVAVVNTGSMLERSGSDRRQARAIIQSVFEQNYDYRDYNTIPENATLSENVVVDERDGNPLNGILTTQIAIDTITTNNGVEVPLKRIAISCKWVETNGAGDSIVLAKIITRAQQ